MRKSYFDNWDDFYAASEQLYLDEPSAFKYTMKYRHCDGKMVGFSTPLNLDMPFQPLDFPLFEHLILFQVLKVTNNALVIKYMSDQGQDAKKLEKLNSMLMRHMVTKS